MEPWRKLAIEMFPDYASVYIEAEETIWQVFFDLQHAVIRAHEANDKDQLNKIYGYAEWCHTQKDSEPEYWTAAYCAFYEHLGQVPITFAAFPYWVKPAVFEEIMAELNQLDSTAKPLFASAGTFPQLLEMYDAANGTSFAATRP